MKPSTFVDTGYILALANTGDAYHASAAEASRRGEPPFLTTEALTTDRHFVQAGFTDLPTTIGS